MLSVQQLRVAPNNSFKPNLLRYTNNVAGKACHVVGYATQVGLTQVLGGMESWLQSSDFSSKTVKADVSSVLEVLESHDWLAENLAREQLERSGSDCCQAGVGIRSEEHTSELQSLMRISYAVFCLKKKIDN